MERGIGAFGVSDVSDWSDMVAGLSIFGRLGILFDVVSPTDCVFFAACPPYNQHCVAAFVSLRWQVFPSL